MKKIIIAFSILFTTTSTTAQDFNLFEKHLFIENNDTMPYRLLLPEDFDVHKKYPLILFLHGAGERGNDNEKQLVHGGQLFVADSFRNNYPAIVVFPQCAENSFWSNTDFHYDTVNKKVAIKFKKDGAPTKAMKLLLNVFKELDEKYPLDKNRLYAGGLSMGGMGTFEIVRRIPGTFAAAFAICGGADTSTAEQISNTAWWIFHGLKDPVVDPQFSKDMAAALKNAGADVKLTLYPGDGHNSWDDAFKEPDLFPWLFSHNKK